jgi:hypothetical protein
MGQKAWRRRPSIFRLTQPVAEPVFLLSSLRVRNRSVGRWQINRLALTKLDGHPLDQVELSSADGRSDTRGSDDVAIIPPTSFLKFLIVPRSIVANHIPHSQRLALKVRSIGLTHHSFQPSRALIANFKIKLNQRVDTAFVWFERRISFQVYPDAFKDDCTGRHCGIGALGVQLRLRTYHHFLTRCSLTTQFSDSLGS